MTLNAADNPKLMAAVKAALKDETPKRAPVDPNHSPFGHVRLAGSGGGWICSLCRRPVVDDGPGEWRHR